MTLAGARAPRRSRRWLRPGSILLEIAVLLAVVLFATGFPALAFVLLLFTALAAGLVKAIAETWRVAHRPGPAAVALTAPAPGGSPVAVDRRHTTSMHPGRWGVLAERLNYRVALYFGLGFRRGVKEFPQLGRDPFDLGPYGHGELDLYFATLDYYLGGVFDGWRLVLTGWMLLGVGVSWFGDRVLHSHAAFLLGLAVLGFGGGSSLTAEANIGLLRRPAFRRARKRHEKNGAIDDIALQSIYAARTPGSTLIVQLVVGVIVALIFSLK